MAEPTGYYDEFGNWIEGPPPLPPADPAALVPPDQMVTAPNPVDPNLAAPTSAGYYDAQGNWVEGTAPPPLPAPTPGPAYDPYANPGAVQGQSTNAMAAAPTLAPTPPPGESPLATNSTLPPNYTVEGASPVYADPGPAPVLPPAVVDVPIDYAPSSTTMPAAPPSQPIPHMPEGFTGPPVASDVLGAPGSRYGDANRYADGAPQLPPPATIGDEWKVATNSTLPPGWIANPERGLVAPDPIIPGTTDWGAPPSQRYGRTEIPPGADFTWDDPLAPLPTDPTAGLMPEGTGQGNPNAPFNVPAMAAQLATDVVYPFHENVVQPASEWADTEMVQPANEWLGRNAGETADAISSGVSTVAGLPATQLAANVAQRAANDVAAAPVVGLAGDLAQQGATNVANAPATQLAGNVALKTPIPKLVLGAANATKAVADYVAPIVPDAPHFESAKPQDIVSGLGGMWQDASTATWRDDVQAGIDRITGKESRVANIWGELTTSDVVPAWIEQNPDRAMSVYNAAGGGDAGLDAVHEDYQSTQSGLNRFLGDTVHDPSMLAPVVGNTFRGAAGAARLMNAEKIAKALEIGADVLETGADPLFDGTAILAPKVPIVGKLFHPTDRQAARTAAAEAEDIAAPGMRSYDPASVGRATPGTMPPPPGTTGGPPTTTGGTGTGAPPPSPSAPTIATRTAPIPTLNLEAQPDPNGGVMVRDLDSRIVIKRQFPDQDSAQQWIDQRTAPPDAGTAVRTAPLPAAPEADLHSTTAPSQPTVNGAAPITDAPDLTGKKVLRTIGGRDIISDAGGSGMVYVREPDGTIVSRTGTIDQAEKEAFRLRDEDLRARGITPPIVDGAAPATLLPTGATDLPTVTTRPGTETPPRTTPWTPAEVMAETGTKNPTVAIQEAARRNAETPPVNGAAPPVNRVTTNQEPPRDWPGMADTNPVGPPARAAQKVVDRTTHVTNGSQQEAIRNKVITATQGDAPDAITARRQLAPTGKKGPDPGEPFRGYQPGQTPPIIDKNPNPPKWVTARLETNPKDPHALRAKGLHKIANDNWNDIKAASDELASAAPSTPGAAATPSDPYWTQHARIVEKINARSPITTPAGYDAALDAVSSGGGRAHSTTMLSRQIRLGLKRGIKVLPDTTPGGNRLTGDVVNRSADSRDQYLRLRVGDRVEIFDQPKGYGRSYETRFDGQLIGTDPELPQAIARADQALGATNANTLDPTANPVNQTGIAVPSPKQVVNAGNARATSIKDRMAPPSPMKQIAQGQRRLPSASAVGTRRGIILSDEEEALFSKQMPGRAPGTTHEDVAFGHLDELANGQGLAQMKAAADAGTGPKLTPQQEKQLRQIQSRWKDADLANLNADTRFQLAHTKYADEVRTGLGLNKLDPIYSGPLGKTLKGYDAYMGARRAMALHSRPRIIPYILAQNIGNAIMAGIHDPKYLTGRGGLWDPVNNRNVWRSLNGVEDQTHYAKTMDGFGLPRNSDIVAATSRDEIGGHMPLVDSSNPVVRGLGNVLMSKAGRNLAKVSDTTFRQAIATKNIDEIAGRMVRDLAAHAKEQAARRGIGLSPSQIDTIIDDLAAMGKKRTGGGAPAFSAEELKAALVKTNPSANRQALDGWATRVSRDWRQATYEMKKTAEREAIKITGNLNELNIDAIASRFVMFHTWSSRALPRYMNQALTNPILATTYFRAAEAMERHAEQGNYPKAVQDKVKVFNSLGGFSIFTDTNVAFPMMLGIGEKMGMDDNGDLTNAGKVLDLIERFVPLAPLVKAGFHYGGFSGPGSYPPSLLGLSPWQRVIGAAANEANAHGLLPEWMGGGDGLLPAPMEKISNQAAALIGGWIGVDPVQLQDPNMWRTRQINGMIAEAAEDAHPGDPDAALAAAREAVDNPGNPLYDAAYARWADANAIQRAAGLVSPVPITTRLNSMDQRARTSGQGFTTPEGEAAVHMKGVVESGGEADRNYEAEWNAYNEIGEDETKRLKSIYDKIGNNNTERPIIVGGKTYTKDDLAKMTQSERYDLAEQSLNEVGLGHMPDKFKEMTEEQDAYLRTHPDAAGTKELGERARDYPGGEDAFIEATAKGNPSYRNYIENLDQPPGTEEFRKAATNSNAYQAINGIRDSTFDSTAKPDVGGVTPYVAGVPAGQTLQQARVERMAKERGDDIADDIYKVDQFGKQLEAVGGKLPADPNASLDPDSRYAAEQLARKELGLPPGPTQEEDKANTEQAAKNLGFEDPELTEEQQAEVKRLKNERLGIDGEAYDDRFSAVAKEKGYSRTLTDAEQDDLNARVQAKIGLSDEQDTQAFYDAKEANGYAYAKWSDIPEADQEAITATKDQILAEQYGITQETRDAAYDEARKEGGYESTMTDAQRDEVYAQLDREYGITKDASDEAYKQARADAGVPLRELTDEEKDALYAEADRLGGVSPEESEKVNDWISDKRYLSEDALVYQKAGVADPHRWALEQEQAGKGPPPFVEREKTPATPVATTTPAPARKQIAAPGGQWATLDQYNDHYVAAEEKTGVPANLIKAVQAVESGFGEVNKVGGENANRCDIRAGDCLAANTGIFQSTAAAYGLDYDRLYTDPAYAAEGVGTLLKNYYDDPNSKWGDSTPGTVGETYGWEGAVQVFFSGKPNSTGWQDEFGNEDGAYAQNVLSQQRTLDAASPSAAATGATPTDPAKSGGYGFGDIDGSLNGQITQGLGPNSFSQGEGSQWYSNGYGESLGLPPLSHTGVDVGIARGSALYAPVGGTVVTVGGTGSFDDTQGGTGELRLQLDNGDQLIFGHTADATVQVGDRVEPGQLVGHSGTFGTGDHVHVEYLTPSQETSSGWQALDPTDALGSITGTASPAGSSGVTTSGQLVTPMVEPGEELNLRAAPNGDIVGTATRGQPLHLVGDRQGDWVKVATPAGQEYWVSAAYLAKAA